MTKRLQWAGIGAALALWALASCGVSIQPLMPTPILFTQGGPGPLAHVPAAERWTPRRVYYATDRRRIENRQEIAYGNTPSETVSVGLSVIRFGDRDVSWEDLERASMVAPRERAIELENDGVVETGVFPRGAPPEEAALPNWAGWILEDMNDAIADARDKDILIYVHGAKVNFYNGCAFAAQLDHFMGRDMTSIAFCWPTRQNVLSYAIGPDRRRAYVSAESLASLVELLAYATDARRINILCWSAGGRVTTEAFRLLRERHRDEPLEDLRTRLRLGTVYFAAADVPLDEFLVAMPTINALVDGFIVTVSSSDQALATASRFMGGGRRIGQHGKKLTDEQIALLEAQDRLTVVDVSLGSEERGFDISGHRYWFDHPWASSDVILAIRSDLDPAERGLQQRGSPRYWYVPEDYPQRIAGILSQGSPRKW